MVLFPDVRDELAGKNDIAAVTTWRPFQVAFRSGLLERDALWSYIQVLRKARRGMPPGVHDLRTFQSWLDG